jgi:membrane-associated protease RseP (regulator of RpoE activity)
MRFWPRRRRSVVAPLPSEDLLVTEARLRLAAEDVLAVHDRQIRGPVVVFRGALRVAHERAIDVLLQRFAPLGYMPILRADTDGSADGGRVMVQAWPAVAASERPRQTKALVLFLLTVVSTFLAGYYFTGSETFDRYRALQFPGWLVTGTPFAATLLAILGVHELGHYVTARHYRASVSLPYFIPLPPIYVPGLAVVIPTFGTLGAVIRMRSLARDRNALFDIAAAGPLAGLLVAVPALILGLAWSHVVPMTSDHGFGGFGHSLFTRLFVYLRFGPTEGLSVMTHPMADAAWVGCFVTALNLFPVGQLDGGRIAYALSGPLHRRLGIVAWVGMLVMGVLTHSGNWFMWAALLFFLVGFDHSPTLDDLTPLSPARRLLGVVCLVLLVLLVPPIPIPL